MFYNTTFIFKKINNWKSFKQIDFQIKKMRKKNKT